VTRPGPASTRPKYRFCWSCSRQLYGNRHRLRMVHGNIVVLHVECAKEMERAGEGEAVSP
jgi:hypothetical protein